MFKYLRCTLQLFSRSPRSRTSVSDFDLSLVNPLKLLSRNMDSRRITLVLCFLMFASMATAMPAEGANDAYNDSEFFEDLSGMVTDAWDYIEPPLEAVSELLYARAVSPIGSGTAGWQLGLAPSATAPLPSVYPDTALGDPHLQIQLQTPQLQYPSPSVAQRQLPAYPDYVAIAPMPSVARPPLQYDNIPPLAEQTQDHPGAVLELSTQAVDILDTQPSPHQAFATADWLDNTYTTGDRVQPSRSGRARQRRQPRTTPGLIRCNRAGCAHTCDTMADLRHHQRYHAPNGQRRHPCPQCYRRFVSPREVTRHLVSHGVGPRHLCPHEGCPFATQGFGRRDHMLRHISSRHRTDSVISTSGTTS